MAAFSQTGLSNLIDDTRHLFHNRGLLGTTAAIVILLALFVVLPVGSVLLKSFTVTFPTVTVSAKYKIDNPESKTLVNQTLLASLKGLKGVEKIWTTEENNTFVVVVRFQKIWDDLKGLHDIEKSIGEIKGRLNPYVGKIHTKLGTETIYSFLTYKKFFSTTYYHRALRNSLILAITTTLTVIFLAFIFAFLTVNGPNLIRAPVRILVLIPFAAPRVVFALSLILLGGRMGIVTQFFDLPFNIYGWPGVIVAQVITLLPVGYLLIENVLRSMEPNIEDAATDMGASDVDILFRITIPLAAPGILKGALLVFVLSLSDFANPMLIGGEVPFLVKEAYLIYIGQSDLEMTAVFCIMLVIPSLIIYIFHEYVLKGNRYTTIGGKPQQAEKRKISPKIFILMMSVAVPILILVIASIGIIFVGAFTKIIMVNNSFTFEHFNTSIGIRSLITSLKFALSSAFIAPILGVTIAYFLVRKRIPFKSVLEFTTLLGFAVPGTVIGVGYILFFNTPHLNGLIPKLTGTFLIMVINEIFRNLSVSLEAGVSKLHQVDISIEEAAIDMRAGSFRVFVSIVLPLIGSSLLAGFIYTFMVAMIAISSVIFLISPGKMLASIFILSAAKQGFMGMACAISVMLMLVIGVCLCALNFLPKSTKTTTN